MTKALKKIQSDLKKKKIDALLLEGEVPLLYLTGLHFSAGKILVTQDDATLFVDGRYSEIAKERSPIPSLLEDDKNWKKAVSRNSTIGFDGEFLSWEKVEGLKRQFPEIEWVSIPSPLNRIRAQKGTDEIKKLRAAAKLGSEGYDFLIPLLKEGVTEAELAFRLDRFWREKGGQKFSFEPIIAFGENSALPHWRVSDRALKKGDTVLIDIGVTLKDYHSDMTRTLYFGQPPKKLKKIYEVVKEAQKRAIKLIKEGVTLGESDLAARSYIDSQGFGKAFSHSLGHGIGLEVHEWPYLRSKGADKDEPLKAGMCVTVEPGIYLPNLGGVRIEDTVLVTKTGCESLTKRSTDFKVVL